MHLDYIEIGTSDFDTLLQNTDLSGLSIDPLRFYLDSLPDKINNQKINAAISNFDGKCDVFYIDPSDIEKYNLPLWLRGCNSIMVPHKSAIDILKERGLISIYKRESVDAMKWETLIKSKSITSIEYLKIDTEGHDCVIIEDILNSKNSVYPKRISFEANSLTSEEHIENTIELLKKNGYVLVSRDHENVTVVLENRDKQKMKIDKVIFSVDDNPKYKDLWPIVSEICFKKLGVIPVLFHITEENTDFYNDEYGIVKKIKSINGISSGIQSQLIRMWGTRFFPDEVCLTSDIDMFMFSKEYFIDQVRSFEKDDLVIYCSDAYDTRRSECVGIYGENRYPICYNAATGNTFNKILGTENSFENYIEKVLSMGFPDFDSDEMYFGYRVNNFNHGVNVVKLERGFYSEFKCPRRIDRIDDSIFNEYEDSLIYNGYYVDCHLSRPVYKYRKEIDCLRKKILKNKEVYLIGCHIENNKQLSLLSELVGILIENGKDYVITSHTTIPESIVKNSSGFLYDPINPKYKTWDLISPNKYTISYPEFSIESPYITYGRRDYYHVGVLRLLSNGLNYLKNTHYEIIHWIEYDALPNFSVDKEAIKILNDKSFVFYGIGSKFSFRRDMINDEFLGKSDDDLMSILYENDYVAEKVIQRNLVKGEMAQYDVAGKNDFYGRYSHNSAIKFDWSLYEHDNNLNVFIVNHGESPLYFSINYGNSIREITANPGMWLLQPLSTISNLFKITIKVNGDVLLDKDLSDSKVYEKIVKSVTIRFN